MPGFTLTINGERIRAGQAALAVAFGVVTLDEIPRADGTYPRDTIVTLEVNPTVPGSFVSWGGVDSRAGNFATLRMRRNTSLILGILLPESVSNQRPTATPIPFAVPAPAATVVPTPTPAPTPTPVPSGSRIVFSSELDGNEEIYVMDADGANRKRLTNHPARDFDPSWSSDGATIIFSSDRTGNIEIFSMNPDGSNVKQLTLTR